MPRFNVLVTRDATESTVVDVTAANVDEAIEAALHEARTSPGAFDWTPDDGTGGDPYVVGPEVVDLDPNDDAAYEEAARAHGWTRGGDDPGIIYNTNHYDSWKEAASWAGDGGPNDNGPTYSSWKECCEEEAIPVPIEETEEEGA